MSDKPSIPKSCQGLGGTRSLCLALETPEPRQQVAQDAVGGIGEV
jgi:hypothetical protein